MKIVRFVHENAEYYGVLEGDTINLSSTKSVPGTLKLAEVSLLPPVKPSKIVCVGLNYKDHAKELGMALPRTPVIFIKPSTSVIGPEEDIVYPAVSSRVDYEAELAVVMKDTTRNISAGEAADHIAGYTCINDVTARDIQKEDIQWTRSKSFDTFAPLGPWIETELDPSRLEISSYVNGERKQHSSTSLFVFDVPALVSFISGIMTLLPGDVIATGTPPNVGPLAPGDEVVVEIEGIGRLRNFVKAQW